MKMGDLFRLNCSARDYNIQDYCNLTKPFRAINLHNKIIIFLETKNHRHHSKASEIIFLHSKKLYIAYLWNCDIVKLFEKI